MVCAALLWSLGGLFIKLVDWHPLVIAGIRSGIAGSLMLFFSGKLPKRFSKDVWIGAVCYATLATCFIFANKLTTSTNAILLQFTAPIWVLMISTVVFKEVLRKRDVLVILSVMTGMVLFFVGNLSVGNMLGNLLAILAGIMLAVMILVMNRKKENNPLHMTLLGSAILFVLALPFALLFPPSITVQSVSSILVLGIFQLGLGYVLFTKSVQHVTALEAALIPVIEPLFNPLWVLIFIGEKPTVYSLIGGAVVLGSIVWKQMIDGRETLARAVR